MSSYLEAATYYFERPGGQNTDDAVAIAVKKTREKGIKHVVLASSTGETGLKVAEAFKGFSVNIVVVTYHSGFHSGDAAKRQEGTWAQNKKKLDAMGIRCVQSIHALSGVERSIAARYSGIYPVLLIADTLRLFCQGVKVGVEIAIMAADAGAIPTDADVITIAGSGSGADTVMVVKPAHMNNFFDLKIKEIVCRPQI